MSKMNLEKFLEFASQDSQMKNRLTTAPTQEAFAELAVDLGKEKGYQFSASDVTTALALGGSSPSAELSDAELETVAGGAGSQSGMAQLLTQSLALPKSNG